MSIEKQCTYLVLSLSLITKYLIPQVAPRQVADTMWYFPLLQPYVDHVPVNADLSDLEEKIRWCRQNDDKCREIAKNAMIFYEKYVAR